MPGNLTFSGVGRFDLKWLHLAADTKAQHKHNIVKMMSLLYTVFTQIVPHP